MLKIICVLKSGGDYTPEYVSKLKVSVLKYVRIPHDFICFTDLGDFIFTDCRTTPLELDLKGWWSKIEIFKEHGPCLYLDLDTVVADDLTESISRLISENVQFAMLDDFSFTTGRRKNHTFASGVMFWNGDFSEIIDSLTLDHLRECWGDQVFIESKVDNIQSIQKYIKCYSYKWECKDGLPDGCQIACFHGKPRPHEVENRPEWMVKNWSAKNV